MLLSRRNLPNLMLRLFCPILLFASLSACSVFKQAVAPPEFPANETVAASVSGIGGEKARERLAYVTQYVAQTKQLVPDWNRGDADLQRARLMASSAQWVQSLAASEEAAAQADIALSDYYARRANEELAEALSYTGLTDEQVLQLRAAEETLISGNSRLAYGRLRTLNRQLTDRTKTYQVRSGDSLWIISSRPEVYANPLLWPLVWRANIDVIPNPNRLRKGQVLKLKPHPSVEEVAAAVAEAKGVKSSAAQKPKTVTPQIGVIRKQ